MSHNPENPVVIIEDDAAQLELLALILRNQRPDWTVHTLLADNTWRERVDTEGLAAFPAASLLLIDSQLGPLAATDVLPLATQRAPALVLTGNRACIEEAECIAAGARAVVSKPYDLVEARQLLRRCEELLAEPN